MEMENRSAGPPRFRKARSVFTPGLRLLFIWACVAFPIAALISMVVGGAVPYLGLLFRMAVTILSYVALMAVGLPLVGQSIGALGRLRVSLLARLQRFRDSSTDAERPVPSGDSNPRLDDTPGLPRGPEQGGASRWLAATAELALNQASFTGGVSAFLAITSVYVLVVFGAYSLTGFGSSEEGLSPLWLLAPPTLILVMAQPYLATLCLLAQPFVAVWVAPVLRGQLEHLSLWWANASDGIVIPLVTNMAAVPWVLIAAWRLRNRMK